jgi:Flp pilus assembly protein CpaB
MAIGVRSSTLSFPRVDRRYFIAGALAALAAALVLFVTRTPEQTPILVAGADLPAGEPLGSLAVAVRYVDVTEGFVIGSDVGDLADWSLSVPLSEGEAIVPSLLRAPETRDSPDVLALSLPAEHAVLGQLNAGDHVDVYVTNDPGVGVQAATTLLARDVFVISASVDDDSGTRGAVAILLAVNDELAPRIASASRSGTIDLVRVGP